MIPSNVLTATFLLNRTWPIQMIRSGKVEEIILRAIKSLNAEEMKLFKKYEAEGSFLNMEAR